jgi:hypothetical protein
LRDHHLEDELRWTAVLVWGAHWRSLIIFELYANA